jgi:alpha-tubulin suppressor-like RCC1 family protein
MASGEVKCWGANHEGELGDGTEERRNKPVDVRGLEGGARALFVGASNNCALTKSGGLECWGFGGTGQMGDNNAEGNLVPGDVSGLTAGVRDLVIGDSHMCALLEDRSVRCWGYNGYGSIGDGNTEDVLAPIEPEGLEGEFDQVAIGDAHTCALKASGEVWCWGERRHGQLGDGTTEGGSRAVFIRE